MPRRSLARSSSRIVIVAARRRVYRGIPDIVNKLLLVVAVTSLVVGCKDSKTKAKAKESGQGSAVTAVADTKWVERLPEATEQTKLSLEMVAGLVGIKADGSVAVGKAPAAGAAPLADATPSKIDQLVAALGITPVAAPPDDSFAALPATGTDDHFVQLAHPSRASGAPAPAKRLSSVFATEHPHEVTAGVVVFADAKAPASLLVDVLTKTGGFIAVRRGQELGALPLSFDRNGPPAVAPDKQWIEVRLGKMIEIEKVPSKATPVDSVDKIGEVIADATAIDVLVGPDTTVQDLVTAAGAFAATKVDAIGLGKTPAAGGPGAGARGDQDARVIAWDFSMKGQGNADEMRRAFDATLEPIRACYVKALEKKKDLAGTAQLQMLITEKAGVEKADVAGIPPALVQCVAPAVKAAKYPASGVAGNVVNARLAFVPGSAKS